MRHTERLGERDAKKTRKEKGGFGGYSRQIVPLQKKILLFLIWILLTL